MKFIANKKYKWYFLPDAPSPSKSKYCGAHTDGGGLAGGAHIEGGGLSGGAHLDVGGLGGKFVGSGVTLVEDESSDLILLALMFSLKS